MWRGQIVLQRHPTRGQGKRIGWSMPALLLMAASVFAGCGDDSASTEGEAASTPTQESVPAEAAETSGGAYDASTEPRSARIEIALKDVAFTPQYITARVGQTIGFTNEDSVAHKIEGQEGQQYTSKTLKNGDAFSYKIKAEGSERNARFFCTIHPDKMSGGIVVVR